MAPTDPDTLWAPLFRWLQAQRLCWVYLPVRGTKGAVFPQVLIFDVPRLAPLRHVGTAVVFRGRKVDGVLPGIPRWQAHWISELVDRDWEVLVCRTPRHAISLLRKLGYEEEVTRS